MNRNALNRASAFALLAVALASAQSAHADAKKAVLARTYKPGAVANYKATIKASVQGMDIVIEESQKQTIKSVKEDGTVVLLSEPLGGTMKINGMEQEQKAGPPTTETRDKLGKLTDYSHDAAQGEPFTPEVQRLISSISELLLTDKEIAEGDTWDTELDNPASKDNKVKVKTTYQGVEKVGGVDLWKFKQAAEAVVNTDGSKVKNESVIWVNPKDGLMEKIDGKVKDVPTQFGPIDFAIVVERQKPAAADAPKAAK